MADLDLIQLGAAIKRVRRERNLTQPQLGAMLGVTAVAICQVELGKTAPALAKVATIAEALDISIAVLFGDPLATAEHLIAQTRAEVRALGYDLALIPRTPPTQETRAPHTVDAVAAETASGVGGEGMAHPKPAQTLSGGTA